MNAPLKKCSATGEIKVMTKFELEYPDELQALIKYSRLVYERHLTSAAGGNVSVRAGKNVLITASGVCLGEVTAEGVFLCSLEGEILEGKQGLKPSKETPFHLNVYRSHANTGAVIHAHPIAATAYSMIGGKMPLLTESALAKLIEVPTIADAAPGSKELAELVYKAVSQDYPKAFAFLMQSHGILTFGRTLEEAFDTAELLEDSAKLALIQRFLMK